MKNLFRKNNRMYCLTNICVCLLCSSYLYNGYDVNDCVQQELNGTIVEKDIDPLSDWGKDKVNTVKFITENTEKLVKNLKQEEQKTAVVKTVTNKKVVSSNKKTTSSKKTTSTKKYVKPSYSSVTGSAVVDYAKKYLGLRYVSGGNSLTTGTDCSGFTKLIYKEFGINLSRSVKTQVKNGYYVKKSDLQKGDLIFYGHKSGVVSHVAIYIGNGKVIHQSTPKSGVKINSMNMMVYITARRVITKTSTKTPTTKNDTTNNVNNNANQNTSKEEVSNNNVNNSNNTNTNVNNSNNTTNTNVNNSSNTNNNSSVNNNNNTNNNSSVNNNNTNNNSSVNSNTNTTNNTNDNKQNVSINNSVYTSSEYK